MEKKRRPPSKTKKKIKNNKKINKGKPTVGEVHNAGENKKSKPGI